MKGHKAIMWMLHHERHIITMIDKSKSEDNTRRGSIIKGTRKGDVITIKRS